MNMEKRGCWWKEGICCYQLKLHLYLCSQIRLRTCSALFCFTMVVGSSKRPNACTARSIRGCHGEYVRANTPWPHDINVVEMHKWFTNGMTVHFPVSTYATLSIERMEYYYPQPRFPLAGTIRC
ncbi:hypothetical protein K491DRAFT_250182 [Lophiostoma macrostomum CBS 122681]|uniref:Uncharacterized protein n=1 Tax=Lophiostoma macrostomum CBS 122681 TaxID=1314788 RepID=A0A6A6SKF5_9PLEO|nr:hypothetical protein K491DRAFT_250182 [Lophiostoma macrostomum CBS 122681]